MKGHIRIGKPKVPWYINWLKFSVFCMAIYQIAAIFAKAYSIIDWPWGWVCLPGIILTIFFAFASIYTDKYRHL